jgi:hypothetical protein
MAIHAAPPPSATDLLRRFATPSSRAAAAVAPILFVPGGWSTRRVEEQWPAGGPSVVVLVEAKPGYALD